MRIFKYNIILLSRRIVFGLLLLTLSRVVFYLFNKVYFHDISGWNLVMHFIHGIRFDASAFFWFNIPFLLLSLLPIIFLTQSWVQKVLKSSFVIINAFMLALNFIDVKFFEFSEKRITVDNLNSNWLGEDFLTMLPHFFKDYWFLFLLYAVFIVVLVVLYPKYNSRYLKLDKSKIKNIGFRWVIRILVICLFVIGTRGGVQLKPLRVTTAVQYTNVKNTPLILNSTFTLMKSFGGEILIPLNYYSNEELVKVFDPVKQFSGKRFNNKNVVVIILESFSKEYSGYLNDTIGYTPELDKLMKRGLVFNQCFANGKRSIEALPSIFSSLPNLMDQAFITSIYSSNEISSIGSCLSNEGYETKFYHGGKNGTMGFDNFVKLAGVENYYGLAEYPNSEYDEGWGIFDEPYLQYFADELNHTKEPFFSSVFTLSSHHPYTIPDQYLDKFPKGTLVNHESIGYADYALGEFFRTASTMKWFNNTLFVITADHTAQSNGGYYGTEVGRFAIPLVLYAPSDTTLSGFSNLLCSQVDIYPSIMDYLGYSKSFLSFGESVFNDTVQRFYANYSNGVYQMFTDSVLLTSNKDELIKASVFIGDSLVEKAINPEVDSLIFEAYDLKKAYIQQYNYRMINDELIVPDNETQP